MKARCSASLGPSFFICKVEIIGSCLLGLPSKFSKRICEKRSVQHLALSTKEVVQFSSVTQSLIHVRLFATPWTAAHQASLSITNSRSLLQFMSIESVMPSNHLILCRPLLLLPSVFPSIRVFSNDSVLHISWPKYWSFSFNISPSNECSGLISFRMDWLDLLAVQGTLKSLLQYHNSKASVVQRSALATVITAKANRSEAPGGGMAVKLPVRIVCSKRSLQQRIWDCRSQKVPREHPSNPLYR